MKKVVVLGASGMLGSAVTSVFLKTNFELFLTSRKASESLLPDYGSHVIFDVSTDQIDKLDVQLSPGDYIVNCIGIIKSEIQEESLDSRNRALKVNSEFPLELARFAESRGVRVIQIATDCVFSGHRGGYSEIETHDPIDLYGQSKSAGEVSSKSLLNLRVSIIGPELAKHNSLFDWVARQPAGATLPGFVNHFWNGIPAMHFGLLCKAIIEEDLFIAGTRHIVPADIVSKSELIRLIAAKANRQDLNFRDVMAGENINRTLGTIHPKFNEAIWSAAGYHNPPSIAQLVREMNASAD